MNVTGSVQGWGRCFVIGCLLVVGLSVSTLTDAKREVFGPLWDILADTDLFCARFEQQRILKVLGRPLVSTGDLRFDRAKGILWRVRTPFPETLLITDKDVYAVADNGARITTPIGQNVVFDALAKAFRGLLTGDLVALNEAFEIEADWHGDRWRMTMKPKASDLARAVAQITASGTRFVDIMTIIEASGDETRITLAAVKADRCPPVEMN